MIFADIIFSVISIPTAVIDGVKEPGFGCRLITRFVIVDTGKNKRVGFVLAPRATAAEGGTEYKEQNGRMMGGW